MPQFHIAATLGLLAGFFTTQAAAHDWRYHVSTEIGYRVVGVSYNDVLNVRTGPSTRYPIIAGLRNGEGGLYIQRCARHATWCLVSFGGGRQGWVSTRFIAGYAD
ncbi:SH3 domain-containing protein [Fulvimarina sp. MAC8]|uniref:SH3 domain-containing protein n=1 Tax=Fulvimarina sp. MAC8 TaxID=3162874 RepID=UPI0032ED2FD3